MSAAARCTILLRSGRPFRNRWNRGGIGISIWKQRIFGMRLQREKILCAPFGRGSTIASISNSSGCAYGKRRITGLLCEERSILVGTDRRAVLWFRVTTLPAVGALPVFNSALDVGRCA